VTISEPVASSSTSSGKKGWGVPLDGNGYCGHIVGEKRPICGVQHNYTISLFPFLPV